MAPMTRSNARVSLSDGRPPIPAQFQQSREVSWHVVLPSEARSERDLSLEPPSSYDEDADMASQENGEDEDNDKQLPPPSPEDHEDILHPLREAANRVGREVERFAEVLDGYNPQKATARNERHDMMVDLIERYHGIAMDTVERLQDAHGAERQRRNGVRWRKKMRGFAVTREDDDMEFEDPDEHSPFPAQQTTLEDLERWEQEAQTWDLLRRLVHLRFSSQDTKGAVSKYAPIHQYSSEHDLWNDFLEKDTIALERKIVIEWLKSSADDSGEDIDILVQDFQQNADRGDIIAHGWIHTKNAIKQHKLNRTGLEGNDSGMLDMLMNASKTEKLVTQLDPDAPTRQERRLEKQDVYFERAIWLGCYEMLRRGKSSSEIREWCAERTEVWRSVSMSGFPDERPSDDVDSGSPESAALWRRMCFALSQKEGGDEYRRAVYGILSGDIPSVEGVCRSWDDFVFVNYNAMLRTQFDDYLQSKSLCSASTLKFESFRSNQHNGEIHTAGQKLIATLKADRRTAHETRNPMKMLQGVLIANNFPHFIYQQGLALSKFANETGESNLIPSNKLSPEEDLERYIALDDHDSLRVLTHVLLVLMGLGLDLGGVLRQTEVENVIVAYISFLRLAGKEELIPLYCSQLSGKRKYAILCRNLIDITDHEQRVTQIELMRELGLDVQEFVGLQARYLLNDYRDDSKGYPATSNFNLFEDAPSDRGSPPRLRRDFFGDDPDKVERTDVLLIRSLEWFLLVDGLWTDTFTVGTLLYLRFFKHMHLNAARRLSIKVPSSEIAKSKTRAILGHNLDFSDLENDDEEDLTEALDDSPDQKRVLKKHMLAEAKSFRELENFIEGLDNIETVTSIAGLLDENSSVVWQKDLRTQLGKAHIPTRANVLPLLKGWLITSQNEAAEAQFKLLRQAYLPETVLAYVATLQFAGIALTRDFLMECMELSALVAEEDSDILDLFMKTGRLPDLVKAFAAASKSLLLLTSAKRIPASRSKKVRMKGYTQELWSVKPQSDNGARTGLD